MADGTNTNEKKEQSPGKRGRPKGSQNRRRRPKEVTVAAYEKTGEMPLDYALRVMRDKRQKPDRRDRMAKIAMPFCHAAKASERDRPGLPFAQLVAGMTPDELAVFENLFRSVLTRSQPAGLIVDHHPREAAPAG